MRYCSERWRGAISIVLLACLLAVVADPLVHRNGAHVAEAAVSFSARDRLIGPVRGTPEKALRFAQASGSSPMADVRAYIYEVYRVAPLVGLDPAVVIAQSAHETANWTSSYWRYDRNPAGIGIFADGVESYHWSNGASAARYQIVLLYIYAVGVIDRGNPLYPYQDEGPGYRRTLNKGYGGCCRVIDDLTGRWAVDRRYGAKVAQRGNAIYAPSRLEVSAQGLAVEATDASAGPNPKRARDSDLKTSWAVTGTNAPPPGAYAIFDLGGRRKLRSIQWIFQRTGFADSFEIQVATKANEWTTIGSFSNARSLAWQELSLDRNARWVRFNFTNPNRDMAIGYLAEVEFYGERSSADATSIPYPTPPRTARPSNSAASIETATPQPNGSPLPPNGRSALTGTSVPELADTLLPIAGGGGSNGTTGSDLVRDGDLGTVWRTTGSTPPSRAHVYVDLGGPGKVTAVQWQFSQDGGATDYDLLVSNDKTTWTTLQTFSGAQPGVWQSLATDVDARYVRFLFRNPIGAPVLGYLAEIRVYGDPREVMPEEASPTPTTSPTATTTASPESSPVTTPEPSETPTLEPAIPASPEPTLEPPTSTPTPTETATSGPPAETPESTPV